MLGIRHTHTTRPRRRYPWQAAASTGLHRDLANIFNDRAMRRSTEGARARAAARRGRAGRVRSQVARDGRDPRRDAALAPCNLDPAARLCSARKPASARSRNILKQHAAEAPDVAALASEK